MVVRQHHPEAAQSCGGDLHAELANVALQEGSYEVLAPDAALFVGPCQEGTWETAPPPQFSQIVRAHLVETEATHLQEGNAASQGLRALPQQFGRSASQDQEPCARPAAVGQDAKDRKQVWLPLYFVDHDQAPQGLERRHGLG